ncbi:MAG: hypothetical protein FWG30_06295 [Eubacteriaceae bacterium]|nr:hypothetical protein [Eubacteriaceae bacterium]
MSGIRADYGATIITLGNCTVSGFEKQLEVIYGGVIESNSASFTLSKGINTTAKGIVVGDRSKFIVNKGSTITRTSVTDSISANGLYLDYGK